VMGASQERRPCRVSNATRIGPLSEAMPACRGRRADHVHKESRWNLGDPAFGQGNSVLVRIGKGEPKADDERTPKSSTAVVAAKLANKAERSAAEPVEPRGETRGMQTSNTRVGRRAGKPFHRCWRAYVKPQNSDLPSLIRGRSRMRESRTYGSVRGAGSNLRPYRDHRRHPLGTAAIGG